MLCMLYLSNNSSFAQIEWGKDVFLMLERESAKHKYAENGPKSATEIDIHYYRCHWQINPAVKFIEGEVTSYFTWITAGNSFSFDLSNALNVHAVKRNGQDVNFSHQNQRVNLQFDQQFSAGTLDSVTISYSGVPYTTGFGSFVQYNEIDGPALWTLSQPFGARDWWPCKQSLNDKADSIDIYVTHPMGFRAASNGLLLSEIETDSSITAHWRHRYPIAAYLVAIAVANYEVYSNFLYRSASDSLEVLNYVYPSSLAYAQSLTPLTVEMLSVFEELFGEYPFNNEKYGHAQFSWGGGMEHQTMSFMADFDIYLNSHELAHQWFGNTVTCGSWNDIWLNESLATFCTGIAFEFLRSEEQKLNWRKTYIELATSSPDGSVYVYDPIGTTEIFNFRLTYVKGAMVLNTLRWKLGDDAFFQALRNFLQDENLRFKFALTGELIAHFEQESNLNLNSFFNKWIFQEGYPEYEFIWNQANDKLYLQSNQKTSNPSVSFFDLPLPFLIKGKNGASKFVRLENTQNREVFQINVDFEVEEVVFDPDFVILSKHKIFNAAVVSKEDLNLLIYPNPSAGNLFIQLDRGPTIIEEISIFSSDGRLIERKIIGKSHEIPLNLNLNPSLSSGVYVLQIKTQIGDFRNKITLINE